MTVKVFVTVVIFLFIGVAIAPSINFTVVKASNDNDLVEVTTQACGIKGFGNTTVKLTKEQYENLEQYLVDFRARLNQTTTREEAVPIFKDAVVELNKYGLLPKGMSVEQAKKLVLGENQNQIVLKRLEILYTKIQQESIPIEGQNLFCLIAGNTNKTHFLKHIQSIGNVFLKVNGLTEDLSLEILIETIFFGYPFLLPFLIPLLLLYLITYPFAWLSEMIINPIINAFLIVSGYHFGVDIFFGNHHEHGDTKYYPAQGWIYTNGTNGIQNISGPIWGQKIINNWCRIGDWYNNYTYRGVVGFKGLITYFSNDSAYYIGSALSVNVGPDRP